MRRRRRAAKERLKFVGPQRERHRKTGRQQRRQSNQPASPRDGIHQTRHQGGKKQQQIHPRF